MRNITRDTHLPCRKGPDRGGTILVLASLFMVIILIFAAFTVDMSYIVLNKTQLQTASDASVLSAGIELVQGFGPTPMPAASVRLLAEQAAVDVAASNRTGMLASAYVSPGRDMRFGTLEWNSITGSWEETWGGPGPYNLVEVTVRRDQVSTSNNDGMIPLFLAPVVGRTHTTLFASAQAALVPASGFKVPPGSTLTADVVPIAIDELSWDNMIDGVVHSGDNYSYDAETQSVSNGGDGVYELDIYPDANPNLPSGNRGTVDFGSSNNSTSDLARQILYGLNDSDLSYFPNNEVTLENGPFDVNGDPGISNGIKDELEDVIGQPRSFPIFSQVSGPGNNATYTIVRFVAATIVHVKMTGNPKSVVIQPTVYVDSTAVRSTGGPDSVINTGTVFAPLYLHR